MDDAQTAYHVLEKSVAPLTGSSNGACGTLSKTFTKSTPSQHSSYTNGQ